MNSFETRTGRPSNWATEILKKVGAQSVGFESWFRSPYPTFNERKLAKTRQSTHKNSEITQP